jgi:antitoxin component of MazEF toxin-antitoxin module
MRALQKLVRNGNSTSVSIPRPLLMRLGWLPGRSVVIELTEDCNACVVRMPNDRDYGVVGPPQLRLDHGTVNS